MLEKRIYIVSVGFKSDWILKSLKELKPDFVYLLEDIKEKDKKHFYAKKKIIKKLKENDISKEEIKCSKEEYSLLKTLKEIIERHPKDIFYLNLDAGDRKISSTFILSSFLFSSLIKKIYLISFDPNSEKILEFPSFKVKLPDKNLIDVLREIEKIGEFCTKKKLSYVLRSKDILKVNVDNNQAILMALNRNFIQKMIDWNLIEVEGKNKNSIVKITDEGLKWLKFM